MLKTYKYRIYPTKNQIQKLEDTINTCRILYNFCLVDRERHYRTTGSWLTRIDQQRILVADKARITALNSIHSQVLQDVLFRVERAYNNFFRRVKSKSGRVGYRRVKSKSGKVGYRRVKSKSGKAGYRRVKSKSGKVGYPRFKNADRYDSITYSQQPGFEITQQRFNLSQIGTIKIRLHRPIRGTAVGCIIKREIDKWFACFPVEYNPVPKRASARRIGIDVGIKSFAVTSDGEVIENPKHLRYAEKRLKRKQRQFSRKKRNSQNRTNAKKKLARLHFRVRNQQRDFHHKESRKIVDNYGFIAVEDLNIVNMLKNHCLAKSISDAGWGQFINFLNYKAAEAGSEVEKIPPKNTSVVCSVCGKRVPKTLTNRVHKCPRCGAVLDRDHNAAINILAKSTVGITGTNAWGEAVHQCPSLNQEAHTVRSG